jgi:hypothetical protein
MAESPLAPLAHTFFHAVIYISMARNGNDERFSNDSFVSYSLYRAACFIFSFW